MASPILPTGLTVYATTSAAAVPILTVPANATYRHLTIINGGPAGFFSLDGGATPPVPLPSGASSLDDLTLAPGTIVSIIRSGSTDMTGIQAYAWA